MRTNLIETFRRHWLLYIFEGAELAIFMISACVFTVLLFDPAWPIHRIVPNPWAARTLMGLAMGTTAILIIRSPMGKRSGAHFNPSITLTFLYLRKISPSDALFYVVFQFAGGASGVGVAALLLGGSIAAPSVDYAVTVPGQWGPGAAFGAEFFMSLLLMAVVLWSSNRPALAPYTSYMAGLLIVLYIIFFAPVSGFSINPARTAASAIFARNWSGWWVYFTAPPLGMMVSAEAYAHLFGRNRVLCAKLHHDPNIPCHLHEEFS